MSSKAWRRFKSGGAVLTAIMALGLGFGLGGAAQTPDGRQTPSTYPTPRWVSLTSSPVRARQGPGFDHRILWEYRIRGLPLQVVAETRDWRKVCDPQGNVAWVHHTVLSGRRTAFTTGNEQISLHARPSDTARVRALAAPRAVLSLDRCEDGWCRLQVGGSWGWAPESALFGTQTRPLCSANAPAGPARRS